MKKIRSLYLMTVIIFISLTACGGPDISTIKQSWDISCNSHLDCLSGEMCRNTGFPVYGNTCRYIYPFENLNHECTHHSDCEFYSCKPDTSSSTGHRCKRWHDYAHSSDGCKINGQTTYPYEHEVLGGSCSQNSYASRGCLYNHECGSGVCGGFSVKQCQPLIFSSSTLNIVYNQVNGSLSNGTATYRLIVTGSLVSTISYVKLVRAEGQTSINWFLKTGFGGKYINLDAHQFFSIEFYDSNNNKISFQTSDTWVDAGLVLGDFTYTVFQGYFSSKVYFSWIT